MLIESKSLNRWIRGFAKYNKIGIYILVHTKEFFFFISIDNIRILFLTLCFSVLTLLSDQICFLFYRVAIKFSTSKLVGDAQCHSRIIYLARVVGWSTWLLPCIVCTYKSMYTLW